MDWIPAAHSESSAPRYRAIAAALAADIASGELPAGAQLPTQRALADRLGVTVGTVSRAYQEVARLGLVRGEVGRGSFVQSEPAPPASFAISDEERPGLIDLSANFPRSELASEPLRRMLEQLAQREQLADLLEYQPAAGSARHRTAGARWVERAGLASTPDQIVVTSGAQHGLMLAFSVLTKPGDLVLSAAVTYPGMTSIARMLRLRLEGLPIDRDGIRAESFERACEQELPKALFCMPTLQNPTAVVMPERRRRGDRARGRALRRDARGGRHVRLPALHPSRSAQLSAPRRQLLHLRALEVRRTRTSGRLPACAGRERHERRHEPAHHDVHGAASHT